MKTDGRSYRGDVSLNQKCVNVKMHVVRLSLRGRTIVFSIHQPRFAIFKLFDRLSLLADGRTIYHGSASEALSFFKSIGIKLI